MWTTLCERDLTSCVYKLSARELFFGVAALTPSVKISDKENSPPKKGNGTCGSTSPGKSPGTRKRTKHDLRQWTRRTRQDNLLEDLFKPQEKQRTPSLSLDDILLDFDYVKILLSPLKVTPPASPLQSLTNPRSPTQDTSECFGNLDEGIVYGPWRLYQITIEPPRLTRLLLSHLNLWDHRGRLSLRYSEDLDPYPARRQSTKSKSTQTNPGSYTINLWRSALPGPAGDIGSGYEPEWTVRQVSGFGRTQRKERQ